MREAIRYAPLGVAALIVASLAACGSSSGERVVVRIAGVPITAATVDHWTSVVGGGSSETAHLPALRRQALALLISAQWEIGEAARKGVPIADAQMRRRVAQKQKSLFPGGVAELRDFLEATGQTAADLQHEAKAELAAQRLHDVTVERVSAASRAEIVAYYKRHRERFTIPERRELMNTNRKSAAAALQAKREVAAGKSFASLAFFPETVSLSRTLRAFRPRSHLEVVMLNAPRHVLIGPVRRRVDYFIFEVEKIIPGRHLSLGEVQAKIKRTLMNAGRHKALVDAVARWRTVWTAKTDCSRGYVVQKCRQYSGARAPEDRLRFR